MAAMLKFALASQFFAVFAHGDQDLQKDGCSRRRAISFERGNSSVALLLAFVAIVHSLPPRRI